jgi:BioD-like phosphotransacetylase family protein
VNSTTPRIFVAATEQNVGKTTASLGIYSTLRDRFPRIGFIKPVGQRYVHIQGHNVDEDSVLIQQTFNTATPIEAMSPIAVEPEFTRRHIGGSGMSELTKHLLHSFDAAAWEKDFTIIEGTGHAGVGAVFGLSNARVAKLLDSKVILVVPGGIGRPIDEAALNKAIFDAEGVEILGVIMNKVLPEKMPELSEVVRKGLRHLGLELLAVIPRVSMLCQPTLHEVRGHINAVIVSGPGGERNRVSHVMIGAMSSANLLDKIRPGSLLIVPGDREDIILAALAEANAGTHFCGMVLSDNLMPHARIVRLVQEAKLPVIQSALDAYTIASRINSMTVKTLPGDTQKIHAIQELFARHFDCEALLQRLGLGGSGS